MSNANETRLAHSWNANAAAWTDSVRSGAIASRRAGTDAAILEAVRARVASGGRVLDVGCGEGWLSRVLTSQGYDVTGFDGSAALIEAARSEAACSEDGGRFLTHTYDEVIADPSILGGPFDGVVCNFALLGEHVLPLLSALRQTLSPAGALAIQTLHPHGDVSAPYRDGWREETFDAFGGTYPSPMPWFFRTLESWVDALREAGLTLERAAEPLHPDTQRPLSLLLTAR